jgi:hypothetical protein
MNNPIHAATLEVPVYGHTAAPAESSASAVSWGAIIGGAFVAAALSLALVALGSGLGLSSVSPWENAGASAKTIGIAGVVWLSLMQLISASVGGYIAGRLRTKWVNAHTDEVFFRDTAHGFLVWAVGLVMTASFMTSAVTSLVSGGAKVGAAAVAAGAGGALTAAAAGPATGNTPGATTDPSAYWVDRLLRSDRPAGDNPAGSATANAPAATGAAATAPGMGAADTSPRAGDAAARAELTRIFTVGLRNGELSPADRAYVTQVVSARTGMSPADADKRVSDVLAQAKAAGDEARATADQARKAAAYFSLWMFISLLIGAFCASYAATIGGKLRDRVTV